MSSRIIAQALRATVRRSVFRPSVGLRTFTQYAPLRFPESSLKQVLQSELDLASSVELENADSVKSYIKEHNLKVNVEQGKNVAHIIKDDNIHFFFNVDEFNHVELEEESEVDSFLVSLDVVIEKPNSKDAVVFSLLFQESQMIIDSLTVADAESTIKLFKANEQLPLDLYNGPKFADLDESIQTELENFLGEKGIDAEFFEFVADFAENQEELEYRNWLKKLNTHFA